MAKTKTPSEDWGYLFGLFGKTQDDQSRNSGISQSAISRKVSGETQGYAPDALAAAIARRAISKLPRRDRDSLVKGIIRDFKSKKDS